MSADAPDFARSGYSGLCPGSSVVVDGRVCDAVRITPEGDVFVRNVLTLECRWVDYYLCDVIDPHKHPGALLDAIAALESSDVSEENDEERSE